MRAQRFHDEAFDEGTLTKLRIYQLYAREWLPVFLSPSNPAWKEVHLFDFFAGPGADAKGVPGSPLRLLDELKRVRELAGWPAVQVGVHLFDEDRRKIEALKERVRSYSAELPQVQIQVEAKDFNAAFPAERKLLSDPTAAKLVLIDQFGVNYVSNERFRELTGLPTCDVLFFVSSSTLHRFRDHPAIRQKIQRPDDFYHVHRAVFEYYRTLLPKNRRYFLGRFSIKKGSNIYGLIFGSAHPLGLDKFLRVAWDADPANGEADFDIDRDDCGPLLSALLPPTKITAFEADLDAQIRAGIVKNEVDAIDVCFQHGVRPQHARTVLKVLKQSGVIDCPFRVPDVKQWKAPREIRLRSASPGAE